MNKRGIKIMAIAKMGKLVEVDIRKLWEHEQYDFSKWLSDKENLELLNDAIGLSLTEVETEVYVGAYRCDLVGLVKRLLLKTSWKLQTMTIWGKLLHMRQDLMPM